MTHLYLASQSPRRQALLNQVGLSHQILMIDVPEIKLPSETVEAFVARLCVKKANTGWLSPHRQLNIPVLGADTVVAIDDHVLGKPKDQNDFIEMMHLLSGKTHRVLTGIACVKDDFCEHLISESFVTMRTLTDDEIIAYWKSGEPHDKAGGYAVQGIASIFISDIHGSFSGIMGLPLYETANLLEKVGIQFPF